MNLKKSWVNVPLFKNIIKRNTLLAKISLIAVIAFSIMGFFGESANIASLVLFGISAVILTTCYAGNVQRYMTNKTEANFMASLPIDSFVLWFTHYLAGLLLVVIPLWLESILVSILQMGGGEYQNSFIFYFQLTTIFLAIIYYTISFFVSCIAGNRLGQFLYTVVFYALPSLLYIVIVWGGEALSFASFTVYDADLLYLCMPLASGLEFITNSIWRYGLWHIFITIGFFIAGYYVFKRRSIENTGEAILYKSTNIILRTIVVVIVSLFTFIILTKIVSIIPDCATSTILLGGCIFVVLGCLIALLVEIIFKNNHVYKSMLYYIPIFILSYLGCYMYGNFAYENLKQEILSNEDVTLCAFNYGQSNAYDTQLYTGYANGFETFKRADAKKIVQEIEKNPEKIYKSNGINDERKYVEMQFRLEDSDGENIKSFTLIMETEYYNDISKKNSALFENTVDTNMIKEIEENVQPYWYLCYPVEEHITYQDVDIIKNVQAALTKQDVSKITAYLQSEEYQKNTTIFTGKMSLAVEGAIYTFRIDDAFINQLVNEETVIKQTYKMNSCVNALAAGQDTVPADIVALLPALGEGYITSYSSFNPITDYRIIDETTVEADITYELYMENSEETVSIPVCATFIVQGDDVKAVKVERRQE